jgi:hypothetical protein
VNNCHIRGTQYRCTNMDDNFIGQCKDNTVIEDVPDNMAGGEIMVDGIVEKVDMCKYNLWCMTAGMMVAELGKAEA